MTKCCTHLTINLKYLSLCLFIRSLMHLRNLIFMLYMTMGVSTLLFVSFFTSSSLSHKDLWDARIFQLAQISFICFACDMIIHNNNLMNLGVKSTPLTSRFIFFSLTAIRQLQKEEFPLYCRLLLGPSEVKYSLEDKSKQSWIETLHFYQLVMLQFVIF